MHYQRHFMVLVNEISNQPSSSSSVCVLAYGYCLQCLELLGSFSLLQFEAQDRYMVVIKLNT